MFTKSEDGRGGARVLMKKRCSFVIERTNSR
uniref:Uncharacterized protein n=1 Tax=Rhizophora mucronata TaxID=61149 RepID=A0A2P2P140_RHIMU